MLQKRRLGQSNLQVSPIGLGLWPIAGITTLGTTEQSSIATIRAAIESGINHIDTAFSYGLAGESDLVLRKALDGKYSGIVLASKVGMYYTADGQRHLDSTPETILQHCNQILQRLGCESVDLLYLHCVDGVTPVEKSAEAFASLVRSGKVKNVGISNVDPQQLQRFAEIIMPCCVQLPFNMLQRESHSKMLPTLQQRHVSFVAYWALMKGLLAGRMDRNHQFAQNDRRLQYEIYQGEAWQNTQNLIDRLRRISAVSGWTVAQLVLGWTTAQPMVASVLCGAKTPEQIRETAATIYTPPSPDVLALVCQALAEHLNPSTTDATAAEE